MKSTTLIGAPTDITNKNAAVMYQFNDPTLMEAGSLGKIISYYPWNSPFLHTGVTIEEYDGLLMKDYNNMRGWYDQYSKNLAAYNTAASNFNTALTYNTVRDSTSSLGMAISPMIIPTRPCPPEVPKSYWGQNLILDTTTTWASITGSPTEQNANKTMLLQGAATPSSANTMTLRSGFLQASTNT